MIEAALASGRPITSPVAVVVAHPDDETLGVGARMACLRHLALIHLTDGAPRARGSDWTAVAARRERELCAALEVLEIHPRRQIGRAHV